MHKDIAAAGKLPFPADVTVKTKDKRSGLKKKLKIRPVTDRPAGRKFGR